MSDQENEYEVESVVRARVEGRKRRQYWKYRVKWKGYGEADDTWEPVESFEGSENIIDQFWARADTAGRDTKDLNLFKPGEEFFAVGPPRRKTKLKSLKVEDAVPPSASQGGRTSNPDAVTKHGSRKRRRSPSGTTEIEGRPEKRTRGRLSESEPRTPRKSYKPTGLPSRSNGYGLVPGSNRTESRRPGGKGAGELSPDVPPSDQSENEVIQDYLTGPSNSKTPEYDDSIETEAANGTAEEKVLGDKALRREKEFSSDQRSTIASSKHDHELSQDPEQPMDAASPLFDDSDDENAMDEDQPIPADSSIAATPLLPSHRARAANPLVKMVDDSNYRGIEGAISTKARLLGRNTAASQTLLPANLSQKIVSDGLPRASGSSRPGPGRSSKGLQKNNTSSLLTFQKGSLKTVKGKYLSTTTDKEADGSTEMMETGIGGGVDSLAQISEGMMGRDDETNSDMIPGLPNYEISSAVPNAPTGQELLCLAGLDTEDADALPDFEDDPPAPLPDTKNDTPVVEQNSLSPKSNSVLQQSLALAKDKLFPAVLSTASVTNAVSNAWRRSTIFGPLGLGSDIHPKPVPDAPSDATSSSPFFLSLDSSVSVPVLLTAVSPSSSGAPSLDFIVEKTPKGPPGKFYQEQSALALLDTLRTGGPSARIVPDSSATDGQKQHFERFRTRLDTGELFVAMAGVEVLAFCSSENALIAQRLNLPLVLLGVPGRVLVSRVIIENYSAYADAAFQADSVRW